MMKKNQKLKLYLFIFFLVLAILFFFFFPRLTLPFGFAYIVYLMTKPLTVKLTIGSRRQRFGYFVLILCATTILLFPLFATLYNLDTNFTALSRELPVLQSVLQQKFYLLKSKLYNTFGIRINIDPVTFVVGKLENHGSDLLTQIPNYLSLLLEWMLLVPLFIYFFFIESGKFRNKILESVPNSIFEKSYVLFSQFNTKFGEYIIAKFIEATILGTLVTIGLLLIGYPYSFILGLFAGITNILPYLGPILGLIPAVFIGFVSQDPEISLWGMFFVFAIANLVDMILVFPLLVSKIVNLHPIVVVVSIIVGSQIGGVVGMIIIIPFIAFFKLLFVEIYKDLSVHL
jgi:putative permease